MKNNNLILKVMIALATMVLAVSLWLLTVFIYNEYLSNIFTMQFSIINIIIIIAINIIVAIVLIYLIIRLIKGLMKFMSSYTLAEGIIGIIGVIIGLRIAWVMEFIFIKIPIVGNYLLVLISIILGVVGWIESIKRKDEILAFIGKGKKEDNKNSKFVDTSVIIDGRIADLVKTGFIDGTLVIPDFVIDELQRLSDSADDLKRLKGRQGLDTIKKMQGEGFVKILIPKTEDATISDIAEVDAKLIRLVTLKGGKLLTNDFNLNKVAGVQGIKVLNINELANSLKPILIPGEEFYLNILKKGKENKQGVGYLDDGTMVIIENGEDSVGQDVLLMVTSVMQTSAGRLIFAKIKGEN
ncbi:MAG: hypothetical protein PHQ32_07950 [Firmicutes bacterium]|nr:hypothetical protein [Bacillota bacterium]